MAPSSFRVRQNKSREATEASLLTPELIAAAVALSSSISDQYPLIHERAELQARYLRICFYYIPVHVGRTLVGTFSRRPVANHATLDAAKQHIAHHPLTYTITDIVVAAL